MCSGGRNPEDVVEDSSIIDARGATTYYDYRTYLLLILAHICHSIKVMNIPAHNRIKLPMFINL